MDPITILSLLSGSLSLAEQLIPLVNDAVQKGQISVEDQAAVLAKYNSLKAKADGQFSGPAWQV